MNKDRFEAFKKAYTEGLLEAVRACPTDYALGADETPETFAEKVAAKMLRAIENNCNYSIDGGGFKRAFKALKIKHTKKALREYLSGAN